MDEQFKTLLTPKQVSEILGVSVLTLANSRSSGIGVAIPFIKLSNRAIRYDLSDVEQYVKNNKFNNTGEEK